MTNEKTAAEALHYIRGRLAALDADVHALKTARADRRFQLGANVGIEVARIRWALSYVPEDCNFGNDKASNVIPDLAGFASRILEHWPEYTEIDGGEIQEIGVATGVLVETRQQRPCGAECNCNEYFNAEEWPVTCYRVNVDGSQIDPRVLKKHGGLA